MSAQKYWNVCSKSKLETKENYSSFFKYIIYYSFLKQIIAKNPVYNFTKIKNVSSSKQLIIIDLGKIYFWPPSFHCMSMLFLPTEGGSKCSISSIFSMGLKQVVMKKQAELMCCPTFQVMGQLVHRCEWKKSWSIY